MGHDLPNIQVQIRSNQLELIASPLARTLTGGTYYTSQRIKTLLLLAYDSKEAKTVSSSRHY